MFDHRHSISPLAVCALILQLVLSLPASPGLVLCVGSDGHVAVESGGCADESNGLATRCHEVGRSAPCTDTPLAAHELVSGTSPRGADHDAAPALLPLLAAAPPAVATAGRRARAGVFADPSRSHRSSILRL